ncbi:hypothetical protein NEIRO02_2675, partial [Nematocida sp. AWRm79]
MSRHTEKPYKEIIVNITCKGEDLGPHAITVLSSKTCEILIGSKLVWLLVALNLVDIDFPQIRKAH